MTTVIVHFFNEEYLLPWWLDHHRGMFDHGILIDYHSTDRSVAICRHMVPNWEIRTSRNANFDAVACDQEVMEIEQSISGWKIALNVTEFLCCNDLRWMVGAAQQQNHRALKTRGVVMVDPPGFDYAPPTPGLPLVRQRFHGYFEDIHHVPQPPPFRSRLLHAHPNGAYTPGRHTTAHPGVPYVNGLMLLWFGFSPWTEENLRRKLQIQTRIPESDKKLGRGYQHIADAAKLETMRAEHAAKAVDIRTEPFYQAIFGNPGA